MVIKHDGFGHFYIASTVSAALLAISAAVNPSDHHFYKQPRVKLFRRRPAVSSRQTEAVLIVLGAT